VPRIVVAHSDVVSWWVAVHGKEPDDTPWMRTYRGHVTRGLRAADLVVAPSRWMLDAVTRHYICPEQRTVIHNGRTPALFQAGDKKDDFVLSVGRIWDQAKQVFLLLSSGISARTCIVGWEQEPGRESQESLLTQRSNIELLGPKSQEELQSLFSSAAVYAATSRYEPFGLAPLEAAFSRCALVMNDNPVFHELWGEAADYFRQNDAADLARVVEELRTNPQMREDYANRAYCRACERFTAARMVEEYENAYQEVCSRTRVA
jgi:glycogen(starch) synthase